MTAGRDAARHPVHRIRLTGQLVRPKLRTSENAVTELLLSAQCSQQRQPVVIDKQQPLRAGTEHP